MKLKLNLQIIMCLTEGGKIVQQTINNDYPQINRKKIIKMKRRKPSRNVNVKLNIKTKTELFMNSY
jgi:hypothetical protein